MTRIEDEFRDKGIERGKTLLFWPADAIALIKRYRDNGIVVIGIDGFRALPEGHQPDQDASIDLSWPHLKHEDQCWDKANKFLRERLQSGMLFEITVRDK
jgi:hypothetical protein